MQIPLQTWNRSFSAFLAQATMRKALYNSEDEEAKSVLTSKEMVENIQFRNTILRRDSKYPLLKNHSIIRMSAQKRDPCGSS